MSERRWPEARALFEAALERPEAERAAFVERRAGEDPELLAEVRSLLASHAGAGGFLDGADVGVLRGCGESELPGAARQRIGPWRIVRPLGEGGMGRVYLGERANGDYEQRVAIKVVSGGLANAEIVRRFHVERRILASLEHPGIARLLDGGTTEDALPYFVMEYVEGRGILDYADHHHLEVRTRIELFLEVCAAVEHAHQRLVVHRDIKPSNILVGADGRPKLLDFGIGQLLQPADTAAAPETTATRNRWLTPGYASPEQILGQATTTATDVHGLGVVLFELLTGGRPFRWTGAAPHEAEAAILRQTPRRLSTVALEEDPSAVGGPGGAAGDPESRAALRSTSPRRLRRTLRGDLDTVVAKALEREPARRFSSIGAFAADLRRYLRGEAVLARPASTGYRMTKFVRRHRVGVGSALAALLLAGALTTVYAVRLRRERDLARRESERAREVTGLLSHLLAAADPNRTRGAQLTLREFLQQAGPKLGAEIEDPTIRADVLEILGEALWHSGAERDAVAPLAEALRLREERLGPDHPDTGRTLAALGAARGSIGETAAGQALLRRAIAVLERALGENAAALVWPLDRLAVLSFEQDIPAAERLARRALRIHFHAGTPLADRALLLHHLAVFARGQGDNRRGAALYLRSYAVSAATLGPDSPLAAVALCNAARALNESGESRRALEMQQRAQTIQERAFAGDHAQLAGCLRAGAEILVQLDRLEPARQLAERAYQMDLRLYGADHPQTVNMVAVEAWVAEAQGRLDEAVDLWRRFLDFQRAQGAVENHGWAPAYLAQARQLLARGETAAAEARARQALALERRELAAGEADFIPALVFLGERAAARGQLQESRALLEEAAGIARTKLTAEQRNFRAATDALAKLDAGPGG
jgi:serine/threonine-protein kinase